MSQSASTLALSARSNASQQFALARHKCVSRPSQPVRHRAGKLRVEAVWLDNSATVEVGVPVSTVWGMWQNKADIPGWMPWISSVTVQRDDTRMSKWTLSTYQFGQQLTFSWMARDLTPVPLKKIHWVSDGGLPNRGAVRFLDKGDLGCVVQLTISYELPQILAPVGEGVKPVVEGILKADLQRFAKLAIAKKEEAAARGGGGDDTARRDPSN